MFLRFPSVLRPFICRCYNTTNSRASHHVCVYMSTAWGVVPCVPPFIHMCPPPTLISHLLHPGVFPPVLWRQNGLCCAALTSSLGAPCRRSVRLNAGFHHFPGYPLLYNSCNVCCTFCAWMHRTDIFGPDLGPVIGVLPWHWGHTSLGSLGSAIGTLARPRAHLFPSYSQRIK